MTNKSHMNLSTKVRKKIKQNQAVTFNNYLTAESELVRQALRSGGRVRSYETQSHRQ